MIFSIPNVTQRSVRKNVRPQDKARKPLFEILIFGRFGGALSSHVGRGLKYAAHTHAGRKSNNQSGIDTSPIWQPPTSPQKKVQSPATANGPLEINGQLRGSRTLADTESKQPAARPGLGEGPLPLLLCATSRRSGRHVIERRRQISAAERAKRSHMDGATLQQRRENVCQNLPA